MLASDRELDVDEFRAQLASHVSGRIGVNRDILVFVHGFNTSLDEARSRAAQIVADTHFGGVAVLFTGRRATNCSATSRTRTAPPLPAPPCRRCSTTSA